MEPVIEYATTVDGRRIATYAIGSGKPLVFAATPPWSHVHAESQIPAVDAWLRGLAANVRVIRYDCGGTGLSDREPADFSIDAQVRDMEAVVAHYRLDRFAVMGTMIGSSATAITYTARNPGRVSHLVLWGAFVRGSRFAEKFPGWRSFIGLIDENWQLFTDAFAQATFRGDAETAASYARLMREAIKQEAMSALMREALTVDVTATAREIRIPTLVLTRRDASFYDSVEAGSLASLIPGGRLRVLDGASEIPFLEDQEGVTRAVLKFISTEHELPATPQQAKAALTERERQVLRLLASGHTGKEIADELGISLSTAQRHIANIYAKIGARGRVEAVAYAFEHGMVSRRG